MRFASRPTPQPLGLLVLAGALSTGCADPAGPRTRPAGTLGRATAPATGASAVGVAGDVAADAAPNTAADAAPTRSAAATRRHLERAARGLLYTSESDYPFTYIAFAADARAPLSEAEFRRAAGVAADSAVEARTLDDFFARHIERVDPSDGAAVALVPRYRALKRALRTAARGVRVFRVGQVVIRCYLVGVDARGDVVGLATTAVET